jgi:hypothetical protein
LDQYRYHEPVSANKDSFGANDITDDQIGNENRIRTVQNNRRHVFHLRKAEGTITTIKRIGSSKNSGKIAVGFTSGDLVFTDLNQIFKKDFDGTSLKEECYKLHTSSVNSMEVVTINFKNIPSNSRSKRTGIRKILMTGGSESECSIIVWDLESRKAMKRLSGHKH